ncbi:TIGR04222 domain-containing membrane protein [Pseudomarimonas arenosa]|uniref:TIGR04222 domain-containing membrane protein n=1 Tax=Pseudomarimonas arenosa TaxID=2774145 RepID=A0AAW3ZF53_9GAMM|nr:TIGR04222 domain-containing membrane protein [Pseudomarimonas arenosa]MBD8524528.1 TIGR04222 domain-containing membrane protein [Pseudomarimonas arenosa]
MLCTQQSDQIEDHWQRIESWMRDDSPLSLTFRRQLAEASGWTPTDCLQAMEEYRRFCTVAALQHGEVSPSPAVDKVWHLHLTYSRDYWLDFCPNRLGFDLHHQPGMGQPGEAARLRHLYGLTLQRYQALFGQPPAKWWPAHPLTVGAVRQSGWLKRRTGRWLAAVVGILGLSAIAQANPLDWQGPAFLGLFMVLMGLAAALTTILRNRLTRGDERGGLSLGEPDVWTVAYLSGGPQRVLDAAVAELHRQEFIRWNTSGKRVESAERGEPDDPLLRTVFAAVRQRTMSSVLEVVKSGHFEAIRRNLQQRGWWFSADAALRISQISALPFAVLSGFGVLKIGIGLSRDKPVLFLVLLTIACAIVAAVMYFKRPGVTGRGRKAFEEIKQKHELTSRSHSNDQVAMAVALAGTTVLAGTALAGYHDFRQPTSGTDSGSGAGCTSCSSNSGDSGGDSGGGGGCGGCGGD